MTFTANVMDENSTVMAAEKSTENPKSLFVTLKLTNVGEMLS